VILTDKMSQGRGKMQEFAVTAHVRELSKALNGCAKFTALVFGS